MLLKELMVNSSCCGTRCLDFARNICWCRRDSVANKFTVQEDCNIDDDLLSKKMLLVFVNPRSGAGRSIRVFKKKVLPQLIDKGIKYDLILTEYQNHAKSYISNLKDIDAFSALLIVSGDGLIFEVTNALFERSDSPNIPIAIIPTGSGNGLLSSVFYSRRFPLKNSGFLKQAVRSICSPKAIAYPVNIMHVETPSKTYSATISAGCGLFADIDIESEKWRKALGSARFSAEAIIRFLKLRTYRCRLSYCRSEEDVDEENTQANPQPFRVYSELESRENGRRQSGAFAEVTSSNTNLQERLRSAYLQNNIPKITEPVPPEWTVIEDEFLFIYALNISHAGQNIPFIPEARLFDKNIYLTYGLKKDLHNRTDLMKFLSDIKYAKHLKYSFFKTIPVTSFRFEKIGKFRTGGYVTVDGEVVDCDILQATNTSCWISVVA